MQVILGRYEVLERLGSDGGARVVKARDRRHDRIVALKIRHVGDAVTREDLLSQAGVLLAIPPHPALPLVREDFFDGDDYVVVMDWVEGTDLATLLRERGRPGLAPSSVLTYLAQAAEALTHLHALSPPVIHGDLRPGNLILGKGGKVRLVGFGLSSNDPQRCVGTPGYRAPELASGGAPSRASDVYALAATAFALLTGSAPTGDPTSWDGLDSAQAEQLETAIRLGMAVEVARRPATPGELVERLRAGWIGALPTGVTTFCMSDIEGSTALWDAYPERMPAVLVRHDELVADAVAANGGSVVQSMGEGDSIVSVFHSATDAVSAALAANRALAAENWPSGIGIAVRWGIHTGEVERRGLEFRGPTIIVAARLRGQADGGEILLSSVTSELVERHLPEHCELVDLGPHRLKGIAAPERIRALKGPGVKTPLPGTECPYRGLLAFEADDREFFFGREVVVSGLEGRLAPGRLLAVVGASGSGKSSVLRAGVLAAVRAGEVPGLVDGIVLTPGAEPVLVVPEDAPDQLVIVDQFEELFTVCDDAARRDAFVDALLGLRCAVAIGVRADLYGRLSGHAALAEAVAANQVLLGAMSEAELERAITAPARLAGLKLETGLVDLVLRDVAAEPGALPLLSHALRATWERRDGRTLTVEGYRDSGGVASAIARTADAVVDGLPESQRLLVRGVFLRMTELGEGIQDTRRRVTIDELVPEGAGDGDVDMLVERLAQARLVTLDEGSVEVAHEALIRAWPRLRNWLDEDRAAIQLHRQLGQAARIWDSGGSESADLYRGGRLVGAVELAQDGRIALNATERAFLDAGVADADRERRAELRSNRRLRTSLVAAVLLLAVAIAAGVLGLVQRNHARTAETAAKAQALTSDAERVGAEALSDPNVDRSLLLAVLGVHLQDRVETRSDLFAALERNPALIRLARPARSEITALRFSPDGRMLALADGDGAVRFIDTVDWKPRGPVVRLSSAVAPRAMRFSPDGRTLTVITVGAAGSELEAIDVAARRVRRVLEWAGPAPFGPIGFEALAYSPDGRRLVVTQVTEPADSFTPTAVRLRLLDMPTGRTVWQRRYPLVPGQAEPHVEYLPSGMLLTSAQQGETILWRARTGRILRRFPLGGLPAVAADGRRVALAQNTPNPTDQSSSVAVLDLRTGSHRTLRTNLPSVWIRSLAFTPDGSSVVGGGLDGVHVWDIATGAITESYVAQAGNRSLMTLDPSGSMVVSSHQDGSIAVFDLSGRRRLGRRFRWNLPAKSCGWSPCIVVNNRSQLMATEQGDGTDAIVDLRTLRRTKILPARDGDVAAAMAFLPDGRTLVTGGINGHVTFWDLTTGRVTRTLRFVDPVWWTAVSPDGRLLAVQTQRANSPDSQVEVVQIATGKVLQRHTVEHDVGGVTFSRDGRELVAAGCCEVGSTVVAWSSASGAQLFSRHDLNAFSVDIAPNSRRLGVGTNDGKVVSLDSRTGKEIGAPIQVSTGAVQVAFSPDGDSFAAASEDHTVSVWDLQTRARVGDQLSYPGVVPVVAFEPSGRLLIALLADAVEWPTDVRTWERFACRAAGRDLTRAEWHQLLPTRAYEQVCPAAP